VLRFVAALGAVAFACVAYVYLTLPDVRSLATQNPKTTAFMDLREREAARAGRTVRHYQVWVPYARISQSLKRAVLVAEDDAFWQHEGIDLEQLKISIQRDIEGGRAVRGGSTITQQLAKNLYLSPSRDPLRKLRDQIIFAGIASEAELDELESEIDREVDEAVSFALHSRYPDPETLLHDVYSTEVSR